MVFFIFHQFNKFICFSYFLAHSTFFIILQKCLSNRQILLIPTMFWSPWQVNQIGIASEFLSRSFLVSWRSMNEVDRYHKVYLDLINQWLAVDNRRLYIFPFVFSPILDIIVLVLFLFLDWCTFNSGRAECHWHTICSYAKSLQCFIIFF